MSDKSGKFFCGGGFGVPIMAPIGLSGTSVDTHVVDDGFHSDSNSCGRFPYIFRGIV